MKAIRVFAVFLGSAAFAAAGMPVEQKLADFQQLASLYAKNYAPYEWKVQTQAFDLFNIKPWLERVRQTKTDLEYMDLLMEYVSSLNDAHDSIEFPTSFSATVPLNADLYDGKFLIDGINRSQLPTVDYPFQVGDEIISVDGKSVEDWLTTFRKYSIAANDRSTRRVAASLILARYQAVYPWAHEIGEKVTIVVRRQSGEEQTYEIPWTKDGTPITSVGPIPNLRMSNRKTLSEDATADEVPSYMRALHDLQNVSLKPSRVAGVIGWGATVPYYRLPAGFTTRLGRAAVDQFYTGSFTASGYKIGYVRIPSYSPLSTSLALQQFQDEIIWMQANTDALIIDDSRNPGGSVCYLEALASYIMPQRFRTLGFEIRATAGWLASIQNSVASAKRAKADQWVIDLLEAIERDIATAYSENRGRTGPLSLCSGTLDLDPAKDRNGNIIAYTKPIMMLVDELSASGGDAFPAVFQDNNRGIIFGLRTMGAGGSVVGFDATSYTEGYARITVSLMNRRGNIVTNEFPAAPYVENIGVRPDIEYDYMTRDNLMVSGRMFTDAFTAAMVDYLSKNKPAEEVTE